MGLNEEKPGTFIWLSTLQYRCFGRKSVSYSVNKPVGKIRLNPRLGLWGTGPQSWARTLGRGIHRNLDWSQFHPCFRNAKKDLATDGLAIKPWIIEIVANKNNLLLPWYVCTLLVSWTFSAWPALPCPLVLSSTQHISPWLLPELQIVKNATSDYTCIILSLW